MTYLKAIICTTFLSGPLVSASSDNIESCRLTYDAGQIVSGFSYVYEGKNLKVLLEDKPVSSMVDRFGVCEDFKIAISLLHIQAPLKECMILDGESVSITINKNTYKSINTAPWCNELDSASEYAIYKATTAFHLSLTDFQAKNKPLLDSLITRYREELSAKHIELDDF